MFEVGFTEILVITVLALVVLGPEKLPRVAAQVGRWVGRARTMARQFREQLEEEVQVAETKAKAKEAASAPDPAAAQDASSTSATPSADTPAPDSTQNMYSGVTGEHDSPSTAAPTDPDTSARAFHSRLRRW